MKVSELEGAALDWAVAKATGETYSRIHHFGLDVNSTYIETLDYSTDWELAGPLIEEYNVLLSPPTSLVHRNFGPFDKRNGYSEAGFWGATIFAKERKYRRASFHHQTSALIAAMRAIVQFELGEEVELPAGLVTV